MNLSVTTKQKKTTGYQFYETSSFCEELVLRYDGFVFYSVRSHCIKRFNIDVSEGFITAYLVSIFDNIRNQTGISTFGDLTTRQVPWACCMLSSFLFFFASTVDMQSFQSKLPSRNM